MQREMPKRLMPSWMAPRLPAPPVKGQPRGLSQKGVSFRLEKEQRGIRSGTSYRKRILPKLHTYMGRKKIGEVPPCQRLSALMTNEEIGESTRSSRRL